MLYLEELRHSRRINKSELARRAGLNATTVYQIFNGHAIPYAGQLERLASALGYQGDPADLMQEVGDRDGK